MTEKGSEIENMENLRSDAEKFWGNVLDEYFSAHHEYPPFFDEKKVRQFIALRSSSDSLFRRSAERFAPIDRDFIRIASEVYNKKIEGKG
jgi:hypothetical protein